MNDKIYLVMYGYYSDWEVYGYFTNKEDADKYCVAHNNESLHVYEVDCYDGKNQGVLENVRLKYGRWFEFSKDRKTGEWGNVEYDVDEYTVYNEEFLRSNKIDVNNLYNLCNYVNIYVNTIGDDIEKSKKIAIDLFYQYMNMCGNKPDEETCELFNEVLSREEKERKKRERERLEREKELGELKRLMEKYKEEIE